MVVRRHPNTNLTVCPPRAPICPLCARQATVDRLTSEVNRSKSAQHALQNELRDMRSARAVSAMSTLRELTAYEAQIEVRGGEGAAGGCLVCCS